MLMAQCLARHSLVLLLILGYYLWRDLIILCLLLMLWQLYFGRRLHISGKEGIDVVGKILVQALVRFEQSIILLLDAFQCLDL